MKDLKNRKRKSQSRIKVNRRKLRNVNTERQKWDTDISNSSGRGDSRSMSVKLKKSKAIKKKVSKECNVRTAGSSKSRIIRKAKRGEAMFLEGTRSSWYRIRGKKARFIHKSCF